ncbi:MAG: hypothetical protein FWC69_03325 [Defluviitaleaceae bacterium]|nr:hypothetical protein [Defluviitaleaceae bacterium]
MKIEKLVIGVIATVTMVGSVGLIAYARENSSSRHERREIRNELRASELRLQWQEAMENFREQDALVEWSSNRNGGRAARISQN